MDTARARTKRGKLYYGWVIVLVCALAGISETVYFGPVIGVFIKPLTAEFDWTRAQFVGALSVGSVLGSISGVIMGPLIDRYGARWILFFGALLAGGMLMVVTIADNIVQFYAAIAAGSVAFNSMVSLAINVTIPKWFVRKRGRALAFFNLGPRIGVAINPFIAVALINAFDWRTALLIMSLMVWVMTLPTVAIFMRRSPEDIGLLPDGETGGTPAETSNSTPGRTRITEQSFTLKQVLRFRSFYLLLVTFGAGFFVSSGFLVHLLPHFTDRGLSASTAAMVLFTWSSVGVVGNLASGFLAERISARYIAVVVYAVLGLGMVMLAQVNGLTLAYAFAIVHGVVWGAWNNLQILLISDFYGRGSLGTIRGFMGPFQVGIGAAGPLASAFVFDSTGSYTSILLVFSGLMLFAAGLMMIIKPPQTKRAR